MQFTKAPPETTQGIEGFKPAPLPPPAPAPEPTPLDPVIAWLASHGLDFTPATLATAGGGAVLILLALGLLLLRPRGPDTYGEIVGSVGGPGGGYIPVVRYTDRSGRARQFEADALNLMEDPTGRTVALRLRGAAAEVVRARRGSVVGGLLARLAPLPVGVALVLAGFGVIPMPGF